MEAICAIIQPFLDAVLGVINFVLNIFGVDSIDIDCSELFGELL